MNKNRKGITLIALIITIIVMLILVGVTVIILINSNLIRNTKTAVEKYSAEQENESNLGAIEVNDEIYGSVEDYVKDIRTYTGEQIAEKKEKKGIYGKTVNYTAQVETVTGNTPITWKVFYADSNNIYLIAADPVKITESTKLNELNKVSGNDYAGYFTNISKSASYSNGANHVFSENSEYNTQIKNWIKFLSVSGIKATNPNVRAIVYMLDSKVWSDYSDNNFAAWTIGGPTLDMHALLLRDYILETENIELDPSTFLTFNTIECEWSDTEELTKNNRIWRPERWYGINPQFNGVSRYWIVCPLYNSNNMYAYNGFGSWWQTHYTATDSAFRPIVCLSSDVKLTTDSEIRGTCDFGLTR